MAQFKNVCPQGLQVQLIKDMMGIRADIEVGNLPMYETFVMNLMKTMTTPADELHHVGTGISTEAGEVLDITKKVWVYGKEFDVAHFIEELGDLRFYYQAGLNLLGITDEQVRAQNMKKLRVRYADGKYSDAQANARADKAPAPLSAEGSKGTGTPTPRKFMGQPAVGANPTNELERISRRLADEGVAPVTNAAELKAAQEQTVTVNERFDAEVNRSLRTLRKDEQP